MVAAEARMQQPRTMGTGHSTVSLLLPTSSYLERVVESVELVDYDTIRRVVTAQIRLSKQLRSVCHGGSGSLIEIDRKFAITPTFRVETPPFFRGGPDGASPAGLIDSESGPAAADRPPLWVPSLLIANRDLVSRIDFECDGTGASLPASEVCQAISQGAIACALREWYWQVVGPAGSRAAIDSLVRIAMGVVAREDPNERRFDFLLVEKAARKLIQAHGGAGVDGQLSMALERVLRWLRVLTSHAVVWTPVDTESEATSLQLSFTARHSANSTVDRVLEIGRAGRRPARVELKYPPAMCIYEGQPASEHRPMHDPLGRQFDQDPLQPPVPFRSVLAQVLWAGARQIGLRPDKFDLQLTPWLGRSHHLQMAPPPGLALCALRPASKERLSGASDHRASFTMDGHGAHLYLSDRAETMEHRLRDPLGARRRSQRPTHARLVFWPHHTGVGLQAVIGAMVVYAFVVALWCLARLDVLGSPSGGGRATIWSPTLFIAILTASGSMALGLFSRVTAHSMVSRSFGLLRFFVGTASVLGFLFAICLATEQFVDQAGGRRDLLTVISTLRDTMAIVAAVAFSVIWTGTVVSAAARYWIDAQLRKPKWVVNPDLWPRSGQVLAVLAIAATAFAIVGWHWDAFAGSWRVVVYAVLFAAGLLVAAVGATTGTAVEFQADDQRIARGRGFTWLFVLAAVALMSTAGVAFFRLAWAF